jgi:WD40 repeat protein
VLLWDKGKGKTPLFTPKSNGEISTSWSSASDQRIASAGAGLVEIWDAATLGQAYDKTFPAFCSPARWSPDGRFLASPTPDDHTIRVWNGTTFGTVSICQGHSDVITALAWSRDGNYLASTSKDRTVRVWQVRE